MSPSLWAKWLTQPGNIRAVALEGTELMRGLCAQQGLEGLAQQGYADAVISTMLIASTHKSNESINMNAKGSALFRQAIVDATPDGKVRGFLIEQKDESMHTFGEFGTNGAWGSGLLSVLYTNTSDGKRPYTGMVPISTGYLDEAVNDYYRDSEQLVSMIGLHIDFSGHEIRAARGVLIQALGGATEEELRAIRALNLKDVRALARDFKSPSELAIHDLLPGRGFQMLEQTSLAAFCTCSQERIERALILTGEADIVDALGSDPLLEITCDFCRTKYTVSAERVKALFSSEPSRLQ